MGTKQDKRATKKKVSKLNRLIIHCFEGLLNVVLYSWSFILAGVMLTPYSYQLLRVNTPVAFEDVLLTFICFVN